jgi:hypothetical protein
VPACITGFPRQPVVQLLVYPVGGKFEYIGFPSGSSYYLSYMAGSAVMYLLPFQIHVYCVIHVPRMLRWDFNFLHIVCVPYALL